ncbi:MAG: hypothetical protein HY749_13035 [Gammaproteobacteria bacterium]|nr:hypothetical protein [Gammaproteobacteria bacterium]MBI5615089.1 hypothetical protein [Gammaproteobacteria bacterium]
MARLFALVCVIAIAAYVVWRGAPGGDWTPLAPPAFAEDSCDTYAMLVGEGHDLRNVRDAAGLVARCAQGHARTPWTTTIMGVGGRFEAPAEVRLRVEVIDMVRNSGYPSMVVSFVYPPPPISPATLAAHWRPWGAWFRRPAPPELVARWFAPHAALFGPWTLGRASGEAWLGPEAIRDPQVCATTSIDPQTHETLCRLDVHDVHGAPVTVTLPMNRPLEWRLEMIDVCRFGGVTRQRAGEVEYSDRGCTPFPAP